MKDITIIYSKGKEAEYSLWSIFFSMIGVWVSGEGIDSEVEFDDCEKEIEMDSVVMNFISSEDLKADKLIKKTNIHSFLRHRKIMERTMALILSNMIGRKKVIYTRYWNM